MIDRMPKVGETLQIAGRPEPVKVLEIVDENIVVYDHWLEKYEAWNRVIARFNTNSAGTIEWNPHLTIVTEPTDAGVSLPSPKSLQPEHP